MFGDLWLIENNIKERKFVEEEKKDDVMENKNYREEERIWKERANLKYLRNNLLYEFFDFVTNAVNISTFCYIYKN